MNVKSNKVIGMYISYKEVADLNNSDFQKAIDELFELIKLGQIKYDAAKKIWNNIYKDIFERNGQYSNDDIVNLHVKYLELIKLIKIDPSKKKLNYDEIVNELQCKSEMSFNEIDNLLNDLDNGQSSSIIGKDNIKYIIQKEIVNVDSKKGIVISEYILKNHM